MFSTIRYALSSKYIYIYDSGVFPALAPRGGSVLRVKLWVSPTLWPSSHCTNNCPTKGYALPQHGKGRLFSISWSGLEKSSVMMSILVFFFEMSQGLRFHVTHTHIYSGVKHQTLRFEHQTAVKKHGILDITTWCVSETLRKMCFFAVAAYFTFHICKGDPGESFQIRLKNQPKAPILLGMFNGVNSKGPSYNFDAVTCWLINL